MVYLVDPATGHLRFAHDAGIRSKRSRDWVRSIRLPVGTGMFGQAVATREVVLTDDYLTDPAFDHAPETDRVVEDIGIRSMVAAPLVDRRRGLRRDRGLQQPPVRLRPGERRPRPRAGRPRRRGDGERPADRAAGPLAGRAGRPRRRRALAARDRRPDQRGRRPAGRAPGRGRRGGPPARRRRRPHRPGRRGDEPARRAPTSRARIGPRRRAIPDPDTPLDQGIAGQAVVRARAVWTGDYLNDASFPHGDGRRLVRAPHRPALGHGRAADRRGRPVRGRDGLQPADRRVGRDRRAAPGGHRRPGGHHDHDDSAHRRARRVARGARPPRPGGAGAARDRGPDHGAARHDARSSATSSSRPSAWSAPTA